VKGDCFGDAAALTKLKSNTPSTTPRNDERTEMVLLAMTKENVNGAPCAVYKNFGISHISCFTPYMGQ
jgi:hypothetical protein